MLRLAEEGGREPVLTRIWRPFKVVLFSNLLNVLLVFFPFAIWQWLAGSQSLAFVFSLALVVGESLGAFDAHQAGIFSRPQPRDVRTTYALSA